MRLVLLRRAKVTFGELDLADKRTLAPELPCCIKVAVLIFVRDRLKGPALELSFKAERPDKQPRGERATVEIWDKQVQGKRLGRVEVMKVDMQSDPGVNCEVRLDLGSDTRKDVQ